MATEIFYQNSSQWFRLVGLLDQSQDPAIYVNDAPTLAATL